MWSLIARYHMLIVQLCCLLWRWFYAKSLANFKMVHRKITGSFFKLEGYNLDTMARTRAKWWTKSKIATAASCVFVLVHTCTQPYIMCARQIRDWAHVNQSTERERYVQRYMHERQRSRQTMRWNACLFCIFFSLLFLSNRLKIMWLVVIIVNYYNVSMANYNRLTSGWQMIQCE